MIISSPEFEALFRNAPTPMYLWLQKGTLFDPVLADFNDAASSVTGGRIVELLGRKCSEMYGNEPGIIQDFRTCFEQKIPVFRRMQYKLRTTEGTGTFRVAYIPVNESAIVVAVVQE